MIPCELLGRNCPSKGVHHLGDWSYALHTQLRQTKWSKLFMVKLKEQMSKYMPKRTESHFKNKNISKSLSKPK